MKANLTGLGGIKGLFLAHGEKLGMAIVIALALFLVYKALQQQTLEAKFQPDKLEEQIQKVKSDVATSSWDQAPPEEVRHVSPIEKAVETTVPGKLYLGEHWQIGPDPPVVPPVVLRTDPVLLAAQKLEANGGSGLLAFTNDEIRKQRELEMQEEQDRKAKQLEKESERQLKEGDRGKPQRPGANLQGERGGRGGELIDPEHPNRRLVTGIARQAGIPTVGDEEIRPAYWATVLAKVPIKEQFNIHRSAFENARGYDPQADYPHYLGFRVERAEVLPGEEGKAPNWKAVSVYNGKGQLIGSAVSLLTLNGREADEAAGKSALSGVTSDWAAQPEEVVDPRYLDDDGVLAFPLPPLVGRDWGSEATHSEIPLASKATDAEPEAPQPEDKNAAPATPAEEEFAAGDPGASAGSRRRAPVSSGRGGGGRDMDRGGGYSRGGYGSERPQAMRGERGGRGYAPAGRGDSRGGSGDAAPQVANWLLRFFDFSVEPGKKYKYRVQVVLQDPNQSSDLGNKLVSSDTLDKAVQDRLRADKAAKKIKPFRTTEWSDPSPTVSIPLAGNVRVAAAKPAATGFNDEPATTLLVESFGSDDKGKATQAAEEEDFRRGSVANMTKDAKVIVPGGQQAMIDLSPKFQFRTGITILDIDGGEPLARDVKKPARVLLMDPAGQLFVHNEVDDADVVQLHRDIFTETDRRGGRPGGRGEPGPTGGREGPRGAGGFQQGFERGR